MSQHAYDDAALNQYRDLDFHHPYEPYAIQKLFMGTVYNILESGVGNVGILESPTGTGKSLSLICASLTWLRDYKRHRFEDDMRLPDSSSDEPDWIKTQGEERRRRELLGRREDLEARLTRERERERKEQRERNQEEKRGKRRKLARAEEQVSDEDDFALDDYDSDQAEGKQSASRYGTAGLSAETLALMVKAGMSTFEGDNIVEDSFEDETKIFYCSRTHSQLTQFANELRRVKMPPTLPPLTAKVDSQSDIEEAFKYLTLGSRKNLCINPDVSKSRSVTTINERCKELQDSKSSAQKRCSFLPNKANKHLVTTFRDRTLANVRDIEEMAVLGSEVGICPYYAAREVVKPSEIVTLPYPSLLQKSAREALGIDLGGHVVIIDEAHNLMDAITSIHSVSMDLSQLRSSRLGLGVYLQKFKNRLAGKNRVYVAQVLRLVDSLIAYLERQMKAVESEGVVSVSDLLAGKGADQIDLHKLLRYLQESKLARKVEGYILHTEKLKQAGNAQATKTLTPPSSSLQKVSDATAPTLQGVASLLSVLTNPSQEGRLLYSRTASQSQVGTPDIQLQYILLDPTHHFREIVDSARAVLLVGGTMSPMADYTNHLLSYMPSHKITILSCGHVIPKSNLLAWTLSSGPTGQKFEFTFSKRSGIEGERMMDELGRAILNICGIVPDGVVVFFPSYKYLDDVVRRWEQVPLGSTTSIWARLGDKKSIFRESKTSMGGEDILSSYGQAIDQGHGALLLSVVGGKMSEGINFSDQLGRCVIIVGLPFPNIMSGEWKAKMAYIEQATTARLAMEDNVTNAERKSQGSAAAREFYENACMRAVNQSIGRAIRHKGDFAAIVMIDVRFGNERIRSKLPGWIQSGLVEGAGKKPFGRLMGSLTGFFVEKKIVL